MEYAGDSPGGGPKTRTASAGVDDGVLFHDAGGDGQITEGREVVFTEWDPTAKDDRTALRVRMYVSGARGQHFGGGFNWRYRAGRGELVHLWGSGRRLMEHGHDEENSR